jgi:hypothetical protein
MIVGILFLEETHEDKKDQRDVGLEIGDWILQRCGCGGRRSARVHKDDSDETATLIDEFPPDYSSTASSPELTATSPIGLPPPAYCSIEASPRSSLAQLDSDIDIAHDVEAALLDQTEQLEKLQQGKAQAFTKQVMLNVLGFGILAYHTISAEQLLPVLLSLPKSDAPTNLPFQFLGGFELSTKSIGAILSIQGVIQMIVTIGIFPIVNRRIGSLWTYRCAVLLYPFLYLVVPYLSLLPDNLKLPAVYLILVWKVTSQAFAFPSSSIMLANAAPSSKVLGTLNGAAASAASASRAFGPTISGLLQSAGLSINTLGLPWWCNAAVALLGALISTMMVEEKRRVFVSEKTVQRSDTSAASIGHEEEH